MTNNPKKKIWARISGCVFLLAALAAILGVDMSTIVNKVSPDRPGGEDGSAPASPTATTPDSEEENVTNGTTQSQVPRPNEEITFTLTEPTARYLHQKSNLLFSLSSEGDNCYLLIQNKLTEIMERRELDTEDNSFITENEFGQRIKVTMDTIDRTSPCAGLTLRLVTLPH